nr:Fibronectin domain containing protein [Haemonchus contortus]
MIMTHPVQDAFRISVGIFDGLGKYKELESGNKTTGTLDYKLGNERQELNVEVAVNLTEDHGIFDRSEQKKVIEAIEELTVVDLERIESSEKDARKVTLRWKTKGARSFEEKELEYEIKVELWQRSWKTYSTITHKPKVSATQTYAFDSGPVGAISSKLRVSVTPKIGSFLGTSDAIEFTSETDLKTDVRVVKFGTTLKLNCSEYKPEGSSYWERQKYGKDEMELAAQDTESLTVLASNGQMYYTCYVKDVEYHKQTTAIYIFAVEGPPPAPQFTFRLIRSKPYKLHVVWMVDWREDIPTRRLNVTVMQGDDPKATAEEVMEKEGTVSTDISADISTDISADIAKITVLANATYGENLLRTVEKTINIEHIKLVNFGISDDDIDTIKIKWNVLGVLPNEKPQYKIKIECGEDYKEEKMVKQNSIVVAIKRRPYNCELFAQAIVDSYEGPVAQHRVKLKAKSPEVAPTNVKFTNEGLTTTITFDRIPAELMQKYGESQGCQVFVCKEKKASRKCFNKTTSPETGEVKFENLEEYAIFHVAVSCRTTGGSGPLSDWITMPIPGNSMKASSLPRKQGLEWSREFGGGSCAKRKGKSLKKGTESCSSTYPGTYPAKS